MGKCHRRRGDEQARASVLAGGLGAEGGARATAVACVRAPAGGVSRDAHPGRSHCSASDISPFLVALWLLLPFFTVRRERACGRCRDARMRQAYVRDVLLWECCGDDDAVERRDALMESTALPSGLTRSPSHFSSPARGVVAMSASHQSGSRARQVLARLERPSLQAAGCGMLGMHREKGLEERSSPTRLRTRWCHIMVG